MSYKLSEKELLRKICDLVIASGITPEVLPLEWMNRLLHMHKKGWLYCSLKGNDLLAVAGAFRIKKWDDRFLDKIPDSEEGDILYVPFVVAEGRSRIAPLRLLRYCLRKNPSTKEILYYKKNFNAQLRRYVIKKSIQRIPASMAHLAA